MARRKKFVNCVMCGRDTLDLYKICDECRGGPVDADPYEAALSDDRPADPWQLENEEHVEPPDEYHGPVSRDDI